MGNKNYFKNKLEIFLFEALTAAEATATKNATNTMNVFMFELFSRMEMEPNC